MKFNQLSCVASLLIIASSFAACDGADSTRVESPEPDDGASEPERFAVGTAAYEFVDAERAELLTPEPLRRASSRFRSSYFLRA